MGVLAGILHVFLYAFMIFWHLADAFIQPPITKPDFWVVANVVVGAIGFGCCYLWCLYRLIDDSYLFNQAFKSLMVKSKIL